MTVRRSSSFDWLVAETLVMSVIGLNALVLFLVGFPSVDEATGGWLANAVFVDEMTADNNDRLEEMVVELRGELEAARAYSEQDQAERWRKLNDTLQDIQSQLADLQKDR